MRNNTPKLTWDRAGRRWKKVYRGRVWYGERGLNKSDRTAYDRSLEDFLQWRSGIDADHEATKPHREAYEWAVSMRREMIDWLSLEGQTQDPLYARLVGEIERLLSWWKRTNPPKLNTIDTLYVDPLYVRGSLSTNAAEHIVWLERVEALRQYKRWTETTDHAKSIGGLLDEFLGQKKKEAVAGGMTLPAWDTLRQRLNHLRGFAGAVSVKTLTKTLSNFHSHLLGLVERKELSQTYASNILITAKTFARWCWRQEIIETLPRNLDDLQISNGVKAVKTFSVQEIKTLLSEANDRQKLYLLLMCNTGMTQQDISDLRPEEVDWKAGRVRRKRSKTKNVENVPEVDYLLWRETFHLLKTFGRREGERVLTNDNGLPLRRRELKDGKVGNLDNIKSSYARLCRRLKIKPETRPLKLFRKTGATILASHPSHGRYAQFYLGHSPRTVADRHYIQPSREQFDGAVRWLGQRFGIK